MVMALNSRWEHPMSGGNAWVPWKQKNVSDMAKAFPPRSLVGFSDETVSDSRLERSSLQISSVCPSKIHLK